MAREALSAPEIPLCINVLRLLDYRLAPDRIYRLLNGVYAQRCQFYNDGGLTGKVKPKRAKSVIQLQHNKPIERKLAKLTDYYDNNSIQNAFLAYMDEILTGKKTPENLMYNFLSFDEALDCFGVVNHYLNKFALYYTHGRADD